MFNLNLTDAQWHQAFITLGIVIALYLVNDIRSQLRAIAYNTGRASENIAALQNRQNSN